MQQTNSKLWYGKLQCNSSFYRLKKIKFSDVLRVIVSNLKKTPRVKDCNEYLDILGKVDLKPNQIIKAFVFIFITYLENHVHC